jgi:hypothetical protein
MAKKEFTLALAIQSKHSKVPTDFRFENTRITLELDDVSYFKEYFHHATDKHQKDYTDVLLKGSSNPVTLKIGYDDFKELFKK